MSNELPEAWLNSQAYQKVTATVDTAPIGCASNTGMKNSGACQPVISNAMIAVADIGEWRICSSG